MDKRTSRYIEQWKLSDLQPLTRTFTSDLYKAQSKQGAVVLKVLTDAGAKDEKAAADVLELWGGRGAVQVWHHDEGALLLEYIPGSDLTELVRSG
ncbi:hypothetical protein CNY89_19250, partial [Amaricoccus sp. HAR-UPW-R2A-40]